MAKKPSQPTNDLTEYAAQGYDGRKNEHLHSSPCYYAHDLGETMQAKGMTRPRDVAMSRGYQMRANDMLFKIERMQGMDYYLRVR